MPILPILQMSNAVITDFLFIYFKNISLNRFSVFLSIFPVQSGIFFYSLHFVFFCKPSLSIFDYYFMYVIFTMYFIKFSSSMHFLMQLYCMDLVAKNRSISFHRFFTFACKLYIIQSPIFRIYAQNCSDLNFSLLILVTLYYFITFYAYFNYDSYFNIQSIHE